MTTHRTASRAVEAQFERIGVRAKVVMIPNAVALKVHREQPPVRVNVLTDDAGPYFYVERRWHVTLSVAEAVPEDRRLLLVADHTGYGEHRFSRFLCGHDERNWFVAAIPESADVETVQGALDALKPQEVWDEIRQLDLPADQYDLRWTAAFIRQGEWFFLPRPWMEVDHDLVLRSEPIRRGEGKPHWCEFLYRTGGETVLVNDKYPNGLTVDEFQKLDVVERRSAFWREMVRDAEVYVRGQIRHPDHATIDLPYWHKVVMNTESQASAMEHVAFLD